MRILIADRQPKVRFALSTLLKQQPGLEIVGEAANVEELLAAVRASWPDVVLLHWGLEGTAVTDLPPILRRICPGLRVIVLSARPEAAREAMAAGADAFISKVDQPERLLAAIQGLQQAVAGDALLLAGQTEKRA